MLQGLTEKIENIIEKVAQLLATKFAIAMLLSTRIPTDSNFSQMRPIYTETIEDMRAYFYALLKK